MEIYQPIGIDNVVRPFELWPPIATYQQMFMGERARIETTRFASASGNNNSRNMNLGFFANSNQSLAGAYRDAPSAAPLRASSFEPNAEIYGDERHQSVPDHSSQIPNPRPQYGPLYSDLMSAERSQNTLFGASGSASNPETSVDEPSSVVGLLQC